MSKIPWDVHSGVGHGVYGQIAAVFERFCEICGTELYWSKRSESGQAASRRSEKTTKSPAEYYERRQGVSDITTNPIEAAFVGQLTVVELDRRGTSVFRHAGSCDKR